MIEKEIKIMLTKHQYDIVDQLFSWDKEFVQVNHYYTEQTNKKPKDISTIRIREKDGGLKLQVKVPVSQNGSLSIKDEYETRVEQIEAIISGEQLTRLTGIPFADAKLIGSLITYRRLCMDYTGIEICLDKNEYLNYVDYELELEYTEAVNENDLAIIISLLDRQGIKGEGKVYGKCLRFMDRHESKIQ
jgi:uncharacterized protein YjbK